MNDIRTSLISLAMFKRDGRRPPDWRRRLSLYSHLQDIKRSGEYYTSWEKNILIPYNIICIYKIEYMRALSETVQGDILVSLSVN